MASSRFRFSKTTIFGSVSALWVMSLLGCGSGIPGASQPENVKKESPELALQGQGASGPAGRPVGQILVHRFSGSFAERPMVLKEEVISNDGNSMTVDYSLEEGDKLTQLRVLMGARSERVLTVSRLIGDEVLPGSAKDFEDLLARTSFVPDRNDGLLGKTSQTCLIGKQELDCEISEFQVQLGEREARLSVARDTNRARDISGEITAVDGTLLYRAELIEAHDGQIDAPNHEKNASLAAVSP